MDALGIEHYRAVATSAVRESTNRKAFVARVLDVGALPVEAEFQEVCRLEAVEEVVVAAEQYVGDVEAVAPERVGTALEDAVRDDEPDLLGGALAAVRDPGDGK